MQSDVARASCGCLEWRDPAALLSNCAQHSFAVRAQRGRCRPRSNRAIVDFGSEGKISPAPKSAIHNRKSAIFIGAPAGIRTPNQQIMRRFEGHQQGETKRDNPVFTESAVVKVN